MTGLGRGQGCALVASMLRRGIAGNRLFAWRRFSSTGGAGVMSIGSDRRRVGLGGFPPIRGTLRSAGVRGGWERTDRWPCVSVARG